MFCWATHASGFDEAADEHEGGGRDERGPRQPPPGEPHAGHEDEHDEQAEPQLERVDEHPEHGEAVGLLVEVHPVQGRGDDDEGQHAQRAERDPQDEPLPGRRTAAPCARRARPWPG